MTALTRFEWPGNIRELENCIERAVALAEDETIHLAERVRILPCLAPTRPSKKKGAAF